ncbi:MAG TPA: NTP transferase domain-containing protein [Actinomycetota bacterium]|nr:NTP transferase domain-containing protein [Actinomycetota bacterium]
MKFDAIVLAGGGGARLGGVDKAELVVGGTRLLDTVLRSLVDAENIIVVGPRRGSEADVEWLRESPPGGGPVAGIAAGLAAVSAAAVAVAAVDHPGVTTATWSKLLAELTLTDPDGALVTDGEGRDQPLVAIYRTAALERAVAGLDPHGASVAALVEGLTLTRVADPVAARDIDTPADLSGAAG